MKSILLTLLAFSSLAFAQTKTVGPSGQGLDSATNPAFRTALGLGVTDTPTFAAVSTTGGIVSGDEIYATGSIFSESSINSNSIEAYGMILTGAGDASPLYVDATWNTSGSPSLIHGRVTNTASGAGAKLIDLGTTAGGSLFSVSKTGVVSGSAANMTSIPVANSVGNLPVVNLGSGTSASSSTFWRGDGTWATPLGLVNFTDSVNTTTPNTTIPAVGLIATNPATNVDAVFSPKGTGSILAQIPDNGTGGGNKRGTNSVDLQQVRSTNTEVASGTESVVLGGYRNRASGTRSVVIGGISGIASGTESVVLGGDTNSATNENALAGGYSNTASGIASTAFGYSNTASGQSSTALGQGNTTSGNYSLAIGTGNTGSHANAFILGSGAVSRIQCGIAHAAGSLDGVNGSAQVGRYVLRLKTINSTTAKMTTTSGGGVDEITLSNNSTYSFTGQISARSSTGDSATWRFSGTIERGANAAATAFVGTPTITDTNSEAGSAAWTVDIVADTTGGALRFNVTGAAATNIRWVAQVDTAEVVY